MVMPLVAGVYWYFVYIANIVRDSELCGILGFTTFRLMRGMLDTVSNNVTLCGPGTVDPRQGTRNLKWSHRVNCEISTSRHMVIHCADFQLADDDQAARTAIVPGRQSIHYHFESTRQHMESPRLSILGEQNNSQFIDFEPGI